MKLSERLRYLADFPSQESIAPLLQSAADVLDDSHLWRQAWVRAENQVGELTRELERLRYQLQQRKEKAGEN